MSFSIQIEYFLTFRAGHTGLSPRFHTSPTTTLERLTRRALLLLLLLLLPKNKRLTNSPAAVIVHKRQTLDLRARRVLVLTHILECG